MSTHLYQSIPNNGFILTRNQYDAGGRLVFEIWVKTSIGLAKLLIEDQEAVCFVRATDLDALKSALKLQSSPAYFKPLPLRNFDNEPMVALYSPSLRAYYKVKQVAETYQIELFEADVKPIDRYLMERFVKGDVEFVGDLVSNNSPYIEFRKVKLKAASQSTEPQIDLSLLSIDIECNEKGELFSIGLHQGYLGAKQEFKQEFKPGANPEPRPRAEDKPLREGAPYEKVLYNLTGVSESGKKSIEDSKNDGESLGYAEWLSTEKALLVRFIEEVQSQDPDGLIGWSFISFDIRLIVRACERHNIKLTLGRDGTALQFSDGQRGQQRFPDRAYVAGRVVLDGIDVMKNATYHFSSFSLNNVANEILKDQKIQLTEEGGDKLQAIKLLYKEQPLKLAAYNLQDCILVSKIFSQEKLTQYLITRTRLTGLELDKTGGSVAAFTNLYMPEMHRKGWIANNLVAMEDYVHSPGGFVMDSIPGIHADVLVFDFKSLYPSIIRTFNIDPVALIEAQFDDSKEYVIPGFRGGEFSRDKSILSSILDKLWLARENAKKNNNSIHSNAIKIIMNSFYGVLGSAGCRFYDTKLASSITMRGHWVLNQSKDWFHEQGLTVIYGDTDSVFVSTEGSDYKSTDGKQLEVRLNSWWTEKIKTDFDLTSELEMEFETHYSPFFMPTIRGTEAGSKKRYAGKKQNNDGTSEIVFKGLESVRSDWTPLAKEFQTELFELIFNNQPCKSFLEQTINDLNSGKLDSKCTYTKRIRQHLSEYVKTTPPQIKAARAANEHYGREIYTRGSQVQYVITHLGPQELAMNEALLDYEHYINKQLFPIAESILHAGFPELLAVFDKQLNWSF
ncbi:DNA polymerase II [Psychrosphaera haliotis]|uniref:DNA polymerase II n=1 Tax=Psychrosphaera haliotis TaxID=555083 RepID=UPI0031E42CF0